MSSLRRTTAVGHGGIDCDTDLVPLKRGRYECVCFWCTSCCDTQSVKCVTFPLGFISLK